MSYTVAHCGFLDTPQRFHDKMLNLVQRQPRLLRDGLEAHRSVVSVALEYGFDECHEADLLSEEWVVFLEDGLYCDLMCERSHRQLVSDTI